MKGLSVIAVWLFLLGAVSAPVAATPVAAATSVAQPLRVAYCEECAPFQFRDEAGEPAGLLMDHWRLWSKKSGRPVQFLPARWSETLALVKTGRADLHAGLFRTEQRLRTLSFGTPLHRSETHLFVHHTLPLPKTAQAALPFRIGVLAGDSLESHLRRHLPTSTLVPHTTFSEVMTALKEGSLLLFAADTLTGIHHLKEHGLLTSYRYHRQAPLTQAMWRVAAAKGREALLAEVEAGFARITPAELAAITARWGVSEARAPPTLATLTPEERAWIRDHPIIDLGIDGRW
ncbi:MAG: transporter substrate-binding domain-containing protein, partial [Magnetococcales bacterium]|nr:transporter substrate-binding domain-containing protein [Magnetococcales bacterium]